MRVALNDVATVKSLSLHYAPDSITLKGTIPSTVKAVEHEHVIPEPPVIPEAKEGETPHIAKPKGEQEYIQDNLQSVEIEAQDIVFELTLSFDDLKNLPGFADYSQCAIGVHFVNGEVQYHEVFSRTTTTQRRAEAHEPNHFYMVAILVPAKNVQSFDECLVQVNCLKEVFDCNVPYLEPKAIEDFRALVPAITIQGPDVITSAGGLFKVKYAWPDGTAIVGAEVRSEVTAGYVNRQRAHTDAKGEAYFTVLPLALDKGEKFRLKFGFKHFTGKVERTITAS